MMLLRAGPATTSRQAGADQPPNHHAGEPTWPDINLEPDTRAEADRLFNALSAGGKMEMPMQDMFWGAYFGSCTDKFGVQWMVNCMNKA